MFTLKTDEIINIERDEIKSEKLKKIMEEKKIKKIIESKINFIIPKNLDQKIIDILNEQNSQNYRIVEKYNNEITKELISSLDLKMSKALIEIFKKLEDKDEVIEKYFTDFDLELFSFVLKKEEIFSNLLDFKFDLYETLKDLLKENIEITVEYEDGNTEKLEYINENEAKYEIKNKEETYIESGQYKNGIKDGIVLENQNGKKTKFQYVNGEKKYMPLLEKYLNIDKIRVNLDRIDENQIFDLNKGHWDLLNEKEFEEEVERKGYHRDPNKDIKQGGVVGIDFGTKSTVVVYQEENKRTFPMRISGNSLNNKVSESDYENPTIIEFKNINSFVKDYKTKIGRPLTKWEDVTVSHTAFGNLLGNSESIYSFIDDLKQWTVSKTKKIKIVDKAGVEKEFPPYLKLDKDDIDPIEIYAYYIGSYINNMNNGIFMKYYLSFPVTYEVAVRNKILESFRKGILKSIPEEVQKNEEEMKKFDVRHGANEPAAYAISALKEYYFNPDENEKIFYGVFDFGGGTTDYDFGIFKGSEDEFDYDYDLEHFRPGGISYLGGENILAEMAYEVFKKNEKIVRENNLRFEKPEHCIKAQGFETLIDNNSQIAKLNIKLLANKLRGIWENKKEPELGESINIGLYNKLSEFTNYEFKIDKEYLEKVIKNRINQGVEDFFNAMEEAFENKKAKDIKIFLAGNSSKHPLVKELFEEKKKKLEEENSEIKFELFPALKTEEAKTKLAERLKELDLLNLIEEEKEEEDYKPTGKTGVAYGLVNSRRINIINSDENNNVGKEINFKYYVGFEKKDKLKTVLEPTTGYQVPKKIANVRDYTIEIYYTSLPSSKNEISLKDSAIKKYLIDIDREIDITKDLELYIMSVKPETIRWIVCGKNMIETKNYLIEGEIELN